jgi:hypothetical protein
LREDFGERTTKMKKEWRMEAHPTSKILAGD